MQMSNAALPRGTASVAVEDGTGGIYVARLHIGGQHQGGAMRVEGKKVIFKCDDKRQPTRAMFGKCVGRYVLTFIAR